MAANKECLIIILDVRKSGNESFQKKAIRCVAEILKDKICSAKKDLVSFVLLGTQKTDNELNRNGSAGDYSHIMEFPHVQVATWELFINFIQFVEEESTTEGNWLDALSVGIDIFHRADEAFKFHNRRILLLHDFNSSPNNFDLFNDITKSLLKCEINLIVVSENIAYINNKDDEPIAVFGGKDKTDKQLKNEKYALQLVSNCNAKMCNFDVALRTIFKITNKRPWCWNSQLNIGTKIFIKVSGVIAIKDVSNIDLKKYFGTKEEEVGRYKRYFVNDEQIYPEEDDLIDGYMLGSTPISYEGSLIDDEEEQMPGLKFIAFLKKESIPSEHFSGDSLYYVVHQKNNENSAKKLDALVRAMINTNMVLLCWKIYSIKFNNPKLVVLLPNKLHDERPASLRMVELCYYAQHNFWDFPALKTQKTQCTNQQLDAIDDLIDSMDLSGDKKDDTLPRKTMEKDLLPFTALPHIYEQNVMDLLERKVLGAASEDDEQLQALLADKNFMEIYWQVPEENEEKAKKAASKVEKLFPLEENINLLEQTKMKVEAAKGIIKEETNNSSLPLDFETVRLQSPAEDFQQLLKNRVLTIKNKFFRYNKYDEYAEQMRTVIWKLLFEVKPIDVQKVENAMIVYRQKCYDFDTLIEYDDWIRLVKTAIVEKKLFGFWLGVIIKNNLGLFVVGEKSLQEQKNIEEFYTIYGVTNVGDGSYSNLPKIQ